MEQQKFLRYINQPSKFKTKTWVDINHKSQGKYEKVNQIIFKTSLLRSSLCDQISAYILVKGNITAANETAAAPNNAKKYI